MNSKAKDREESPGDFIVQDGCRAPAKAPWRPRISRLTSIPYAIMFLTGVYILAGSNNLLFIIWLAIVVFSIVPGRYLLCARCPYYGQHCSTGFGRLVPYLFKKVEGKSMKPGLWLDLTEMILLFVIPMPDAWRKGGAALLGLWIGVNLLSFGALTLLACPSCSFVFCPIGKVGRTIWKKFGDREAGAST